MLAQKDLNERFAGAMPFLKAWGLLLGAHYLALAAEKDPEYVPLARFYVQNLLPQAVAYAQSARVGSADLYAPHSLSA